MILMDLMAAGMKALPDKFKTSGEAIDHWLAGLDVPNADRLIAVLHEEFARHGFTLDAEADPRVAPPGSMIVQLHGYVTEEKRYWIGPDHPSSQLHTLIHELAHIIGESTPELERKITQTDWALVSRGAMLLRDLPAMRVEEAMAETAAWLVLASLDSKIMPCFGFFANWHIGPEEFERAYPRACQVAMKIVNVLKKVVDIPKAA